MVGEHWERLGPMLTGLAAVGVVELAGPVPHAAPDVLPAAGQNSVIIMSGLPDLEAWVGRPTREETAACPPVLLCLDHSGLETGDLYNFADDFLVVPCSAAELEKRLLRLVSSAAPEPSADVLRFGEITLNVVIYEVRVAGKRVDLAWMEFQLLKFLMENPGRIYTRDQLLSAVWGVDSFGGTRTVDVHIRRLRQKLGLQGNACIRTVANVGYGMIEE